MRASSLKSLLTRQWLLFASCTAALFAVAGLILLFLLEDTFIDRQLRAAARSVTSGAPSLAQLPSELTVHKLEDVPVDIHARLPFAKIGEPFEMRRADRRFVHVLLVEAPDEGRLVLVYDVTDQLMVSPRLGTGLLLVIGLTVLTLSAAAVLSRTFMLRVTRQAERLAEDLRRSPNPAHLRELATRQQVLEFQGMLRLYAEIWESQMAAVDSERKTLAYLGHELRTPLQSAQTSVALLAAKPEDPAALDRLRRAISRLTRASGAALWLATDRNPDLTTETLWHPVIRRLAEEFSPLAKRAGQAIDIDVATTASFRGPEEIAETIIANLMLNAIQHGRPGSIQIQARPGVVMLKNSTLHSISEEGFGFGLEIVRRLATRIGWAVRVVSVAGSNIVQIHTDGASDVVTNEK